MADVKSQMLNGLRDAAPTSTSGKNVADTMQLKGEAKNSLSGSNDTKQFETTSIKGEGFGGNYKSNSN